MSKKQKIEDLCEKYGFNYFDDWNNPEDTAYEADAYLQMDDSDREAYDLLQEVRRKSHEMYSKPNPHGAVVSTRFEAYHDVTVYEDGHEEWYYVGD